MVIGTTNGYTVVVAPGAKSLNEVGASGKFGDTGGGDVENLATDFGELEPSAQVAVVGCGLTLLPASRWWLEVAVVVVVLPRSETADDVITFGVHEAGVVRRHDDGVVDMMVPHLARRWCPLRHGMFTPAIPLQGIAVRRGIRPCSGGRSCYATLARPTYAGGSTTQLSTAVDRSLRRISFPVEVVGSS